MRLWLKSSERRANPAPVVTDDRKPMVVGLTLWGVAFIVLLVFLGPITASGNMWMLWTCATGITLGWVGLAYTHWRRRR